jgi:hypothetical protein
VRTRTTAHGFWLVMCLLLAARAVFDVVLVGSSRSVSPCRRSELDARCRADRSAVPHPAWEAIAPRYFDTDHPIVAAMVDHDLPPVIAAVHRLLESFSGSD